MKRSRSAPRWLVLSAWDPELAGLQRGLATLPAALRQTITARPAGVGVVEAAVGATRAIAETRPTAVVFVGTAGLYPGRRPDLELAGVVAARRVVLVDSAVLRGQAFIPAPLPVITEVSPSLRERLVGRGVLVADVACPVGITKALTAARQIARDLDCDVENLEAFAVARAAAAASLPFAAILGISNPVGPAGHRAWKRHAEKAAEAACHAAWSLIHDDDLPPPPLC
jgi:futalosine hydrolase